jgi:hypothetical protein
MPIGLSKKGNPWGLTALLVMTCLITACAFGFRLQLLKSREFDPDEFEHLHSAWRLSEGQIPYRDYFEHHTPGLYFLLAPTFSWFDVAESPDDAVAFLFFARKVMWFAFGVILALTFILGWVHARNAFIASIASLMLTFHIVFLSKSLEIRPDVLATLFWLASLVALVIAQRSSINKGTGLLAFFGSGMLLGCGLMCSQKLLLAGPSLAVSSFWYCVDTRLGVSPFRRAIRVGVQFIGFLIPIALVLTYFSFYGALSEFIHNNFLLNMGWNKETSAANTLSWLIQRDPFFTALGIAGLGAAFVDLWRNRISQPDFTLYVNTLGLIGGLFIIPVPYPQYCMLFLPLIAIYAAQFLVRLPEYASIALGTIQSAKWHRILAATVLLLFLFLIAFLVRENNNLKMLAAWAPEYPYWFYPTLTIVVAMGFTRFQAHQMAALTLLVPSIMFSVQQMMWMRGLDNSESISNLQFVQHNSGPHDIVLDGWSGLGVFRPHAWYYSFTHGGVHRAIAAKEIHKLETNMSEGQVRPCFVIFDDELKQVSSPLNKIIEEEYKPSGHGNIWMRK